MENGISVVLLTRNEEINIDACLASCSFAQEFIVVDDGSTDRTLEIAQRHGARIFHRALNGNWGEQKNFAIAQASCRWVFLIDADERVTPDLAQKILERAQGEDCAYEVQRHNRFKHIRAEHGIMRPDWVCRFVPKSKVQVYGQVHEEIRTSCDREKIQGEGLIHYPYRNWSLYFSKFNSYTTASAVKYQSSDKTVNFLVDIVLRPIWAFFKVYFMNLGFLDGRAGFIFSINHAFYTMNKYVKYYFLKNYSGEL